MPYRDRAVTSAPGPNALDSARPALSTRRRDAPDRAGE
jgi:hypothetical protein